MRNVSPLSPAPWVFSAARHPGTVESGGPRGVNAEPLNLVSKNELIMSLIETRIWVRRSSQIINPLII